VGRQPVKISPDTNVLVRAFVEDNSRQSTLAVDELAAADVIAISCTALSEFVWVLTKGYDFNAATVAVFIQELIESGKVQANWPAVDAGLAALGQGGDFADGVIEIEGRQLGGDEFVSFDRRAVKLAVVAGRSARTPGVKKPLG
jgi:predicted nucleic-acid-binding protein